MIYMSSQGIRFRNQLGHPSLSKILQAVSFPSLDVRKANPVLQKMKGRNQVSTFMQTQGGKGNVQRSLQFLVNNQMKTET
jgi:hypothetical protein